MRSAPTLKIWMTPFESVAMLEKLALLKIALCRAPALSSTSSARLDIAFTLPQETDPRLRPSSPIVNVKFPTKGCVQLKVAHLPLKCASKTGTHPINTVSTQL